MQSKIDPPLVPLPPKRALPPVPPVADAGNGLPMRSRRLATQELSNVPAFKRRFQVKEKARPNEAATAVYDKLFKEKLPPKESAARELFPSSRRTAATRGERMVPAVA
jgi:hypothetical protein